jgi:polyhydroxyalkanoate synthase
VSLLDITDDLMEIPLGLFVTEKNIESAKRSSSKKGVLEGKKMARVFSWMRPNDLIWNYWVNNYLLGNEPPAFDILYWNSDTTNLPAEFHHELLDLFQTNALAKPGKTKIKKTPIDISKISCDAYVVGGLTDHIIPWKACYKSSRLLGGKTEFLLSTSGHIQSILNPPGNPKASFSINSKHPKSPEAWQKDAVTHQGSWWEHWKTWILDRSDDTIKAPDALGNSNYPPIHDAPGTYVYG